MLCPLHVCLCFNVESVQNVLLHTLRNLKRVQPQALNRVQPKAEIQKRKKHCRVDARYAGRDLMLAKRMNVLVVTIAHGGTTRNVLEIQM